MFCCTGFTIHRNRENGGDNTYSTYEELELAFSKEELHPGDLKAAVEIYINKLLEPIRKKFEEPALKKLNEKAYPSPSKQSKQSLRVEYRVPFIKLAWLLTFVQKVLELISLNCILT
jgi:Tyrosyl-tRNA synthetase